MFDSETMASQEMKTNPEFPDAVMATYKSPVREVSMQLNRQTGQVGQPVQLQP